MKTDDNLRYQLAALYLSTMRRRLNTGLIITDTTGNRIRTIPQLVEDILANRYPGSTPDRAAGAVSLPTRQGLASTTDTAAAPDGCPAESQGKGVEPLGAIHHHQENI